MHTFRYPSLSRGLCRSRLHSGRLQAQGANGEEGEREEATLPAEEAAQVKEAAISAPSSVASRHVESAQPIWATHKLFQRNSMMACKPSSREGHRRQSFRLQGMQAHSDAENI